MPDLAVDETLDLRLGPSVVDVHHCQGEPFPGLELVLDAVLVAFALDLHRGQHQAVAYKVSRVTHTFRGPEAVKIGLLPLDVHSVERVQSGTKKNQLDQGGRQEEQRRLPISGTTKTCAVYCDTPGGVLVSL